jgi:hypothetical protein
MSINFLLLLVIATLSVALALFDPIFCHAGERLSPPYHRQVNA